ncbi:sugar phosphate isomerase/epimerase [Pullulanibacillus pueri]|uniref:Xylose isomerase n=1 Tax=Pullulanibacillus pueri TaxID=1437324 RepID=A0A8J3EK45_9BACL|nr:sugar phosphate isomerase/epimerase [Pullulanibacillus pueri]MBM7681823.1 sugar phosphate isomerase/epimerase [Pullulanibacillus pueri]GGH76228.1 xylose isomerase [Pullulanibacillus pueri]
MKLGVFAVLFGDRSLEEALDIIADAGLESIEIGTGGYPGNAHCNPAELLADDQKLNAFKEAVASRGLEISALSCHGNPLHPNEAIGKLHHEQFQDTVRLAEKLGVETVITFSGCPGESENSKYPAWVTCPWPEDHLEVLKWQWEEKVIPYWREQSEFLRAHGVRVAIEPHPGFVVYNTETSLRLRKECGDNIGVNFDPSHLFWQNMDPVVGIKALAEHNALYHFHAKDTNIDEQNTAANGVLDTKPYSDELHRSWIFRSIGYGHGAETWKKIISALQLVGYEGTISIEHEDSLMSVEEGFQKGVSLLKSALIKEKVGEMWWA